MKKGNTILNKGLRRLRHRSEDLLAAIFIWLLQRGSLQRALKTADCLGAFFFDGLRMRRRVVLRNLALAFPEKSEAERVQIARRSYQNMAKMAFEFMRVPKDKETLLNRVQLVGLEAAKAAVSAGKGAPLVAGHFGNWELMGGALALAGLPVAVVVKPQKNRLTDRRINGLRRAMGSRIIYKGDAARGILKALRNGEFVALLVDQDARKEGIFVDFFGRPSSTHHGPAVFALKMGVPIIYGNCFHEPGGRLRAEIEVIDTSHYQGGATEANVRDLTQLYTAKLEAGIRRAPDHWFWMHKRWKTRPPESGLKKMDYAS